MLVTCFVCLLPKIGSRVRYYSCLKVSISIIFIYSAFRYNYGPDYSNYQTFFVDLKKGDFSSTTNIEPLFVTLLGMFSAFHHFIFFTSLLLAISFWLFISKYICAKYYWIFMLFLFIQPSLLLNNLIAMRSALCTYILMFSFQFIVKRKIIPYVIAIFVASLIHVSSLALLPLWLLSFIKRINKLCFCFMFTLLLFLLIFSNYFSVALINYVVVIVPDMNKYANSLFLVNNITLNGMLFAIPNIFIALLIMLYYEGETKSENRLMLLMSLVYTFITVCNIDSMGRFAMYLWPFFLGSIIIVVERIKNMFIKATIVLIILVSSSCSLFVLYNATYGISFLKYQTIFDAPQLP